MSLCSFLQGVTEVGRVFVLLSPGCHRSRACLCVPFSRVSQKSGVSLCSFLQGVTEVGRVFVLLYPGCHRSRACLCVTFSRVSQK